MTKQSLKDGRMYESDVRDSCPVVALRSFFQRLPDDCDFLFYKKLKNWRDSEMWYNPNQPMGVNTISKLMSEISHDAKLSKTYTSHCIRSTVVTNLFNDGVPVEEICNITGHKDTKSVKRYIRHVSDEKKIGYANALNRAFHKDQLKQLNANNESKLI